MICNILIGGAAGQGIDTTTAILEKVLKRSGYFVLTVRDLMSRIRGGHNFCLLRFGTAEIHSHSDQLDGIVAFNEETIRLHASQLAPDGFILCDSKLAGEPRAIALAADELAKGLGNPKVFGTIIVGALLRLFNIDLSLAEPVLQNSLKPEHWPVNNLAIEAGYAAVGGRYPKLAGPYAEWMILNGNRALALGAIAAGLKFYSAYPMSPSTSIMEYLAAKSEAAGIVVEQAEDEIAAINMAIGASFAGARAMTGTSGGGFSLMVEALGLSGMTETPLVVVDVQRPGPTTGLPTRTEQSDLRFVISASQGEFPRLVIALRNQADAYYQIIRAFELAERYQIPVILLSDQYLADSSATVAPFAAADWVKARRGQVQEQAQAQEQVRAQVGAQDQTINAGAGTYQRYQLTEDGISPRLLPGNPDHLVTADSDEHDESGQITESAAVRVSMMDKRQRKLVKLAAELHEPAFYGSEDCRTLLIGWGSTEGPIREALEILNRAGGGQYGALVFGDIFPLPQRLLLQKAAAARRIIDIEQNATGQLAGLIRETTGIVCTDQILKYDGRQITGEAIARQVGQIEGRGQV